MKKEELDFWHRNSFTLFDCTFKILLMPNVVWNWKLEYLFDSFWMINFSFLFFHKIKNIYIGVSKVEKNYYPKKTRNLFDKSLLICSNVLKESNEKYACIALSSPKIEVLSSKHLLFLWFRKRRIVDNKIQFSYKDFIWFL